MPVCLKVKDLFVIERNSFVESQASQLFHSKLYLERNIFTVTSEERNYDLLLKSLLTLIL